MKMEKQEVVFDTVVTSFEMKFENTVYVEAQAAANKMKESSMPIRAAILFEMFPFCILFTVSGIFLIYLIVILHICNFIYLFHSYILPIWYCFIILSLLQKDLTVSCLGAALRLAVPMIVGKKITAYFELVKPLIEFKFEIIQSRGNNVFELATQEEIDKLGSTTNKGSSSKGQFTDDIDLDEVRNQFFVTVCFWYVSNTFRILTYHKHF